MTEHSELTRAVRDLVLAGERYRTGAGRRRGLSPTAVTTLTHLDLDGAQTPTELARRVDISSASVTELLDKLQDSGYVCRRPHPRDRRKLLIELTDTGCEQIEEIFRTFAARVEPLTAGIPRGDLAAVLGFVRAARHVLVPPDGGQNAAENSAQDASVGNRGPSA